MVPLLELMVLGALLIVVRALFRAARARPDERGLRIAAWCALVAWAIFTIVTLVDFGQVPETMGRTGQTLVVAGVAVIVIMGYRTILARLRDRAGD